MRQEVVDDVRLRPALAGAHQEPRPTKPFWQASNHGQDVGVRDPTASHHLHTLVAAGLLTKEHHGMSVHHYVVPEAIHAIAKALHVNACC